MNFSENPNFLRMKMNYDIILYAEEEISDMFYFYTT